MSGWYFPRCSWIKSRRAGLVPFLPAFRDSKGENVGDQTHSMGVVVRTAASRLFSTFRSSSDEPRLVGARSSLRSSGRILDISPAAMTLQFEGGLLVYLATSPAELRRFEPNFYSATGASRRTEFRLRHA